MIGALIRTDFSEARARTDAKRPQGRPPARSDAASGRVSEDVARPDGRAESKQS